MVLLGCACRHTSTNNPQFRTVLFECSNRSMWVHVLAIRVASLSILVYELQLLTQQC